ncbi:MAG TPA: methylated-DNA--[protein]-cysteine S-methyltransferase [Rubrivivax sp.]|nr:methylated-DNA--[protein]-cysteine S-methyltransferase [Rubrivivax sp.]HPO18382.1 methylated-DNA--[protein]-cysteine S-methyltransferase [Rubrivivax sp.]
MRDAHPLQCALFDTPLGWCGVAWSGVGLLAAQLPEADAAAVRAQLRRSAPGALEAAPPALAQQAIDGIRALLRGEAAELAALPLDLRGVPALHARVYDIVRRIPCGRTLSYGQVAEQLGDRQLARAVGQAMARNRFAPVVPCHRVLGAQGRPGGFSAHGGVRTKLQLLQIEGAWLSGEPGLFDDRPIKG